MISTRETTDATSKSWLNVVFNIWKNALVITKKDYKIGARQVINHNLLFNTECIHTYNMIILIYAHRSCMCKKCSITLVCADAKPNV